MPRSKFRGGTFYKAVRDDYTDLWSGQINFLDYMGHAIEMHDTQSDLGWANRQQALVHAHSMGRLSDEQLESRLREKPEYMICTGDVIHAAPQVHQALMWGNNNAWRRSTLGGLQGEIRLLQCWGVPVAVDREHSFGPKYGFRVLDIEREVSRREAMKLMCSEGVRDAPRYDCTLRRHVARPERPLTTRERSALTNSMVGAPIHGGSWKKAMEHRRMRHVDADQHVKTLAERKPEVFK